jgi:type VI secretion system protein ImpM
VAYGLFGKLPQKRDFVALGIPNAVLHPFETWLQSAVAASRNELGGDWEELFLVAPIWRFWLGQEILGQVCAGALMPSVDKVGRFFPLAIMHVTAPGQEGVPPVFSPVDDWYAEIESRLLSVLAEDAEMEIASLTAGLAEPGGQPEPPGPPGEIFKGGIIWTGEAGSAAGDLVRSLLEADYWQAAAGRSFWWTGGGSGGRPVAHVRPGLPDPYFFTRMLKAGVT